MIWPFKKKAPSDIDIFKSFARAIFDEVIAGEDYAGKVFRAQSVQNIREFWSGKCKDIESWVGNDPAARGKHLREQWAQCVEHLALGRFYASLPDDDRELFAKQALESTRETQDTAYGHQLAIQILDVRILEGMIRHGWDGAEGVRDHLFELARILDEQCTAQYQFMLESARAKTRGETITEARRESAKTDMLLKEASRRRLAGIPFDDERQSKTN
jgi:hypothetical protein